MICPIEEPLYQMHSNECIFIFAYTNVGMYSERQKKLYTKEIF